MDMKIDLAFIEHLYQIPWFENCGNDTQDFGLCVKNKDEVIKRISSMKWSNTVLDFQGDITSKLCLRQIHGEGDEYKCWNELVNEFKTLYLPKLDAIWSEKLKPLELDTKQVMDDIRFNVLGLTVIHTYNSIIEYGEFFSKMLLIYEARHLPCGWYGKKDFGTFYVF